MTDVRMLLASRMPGYDVRDVELAGFGLDNTAYVVNGELIVRFAKDLSSADVEREARLLTLAAAVSPLPIPTPVFVEPDLGCFGYRMVPGIPVLDLGASVDGVAVGRQLGPFLAALHAAPVDAFNGVVEHDVEPHDEWLADAADLFASVRSEVPDEYGDPIGRFLSAKPPADPVALVFSHNDLGIEHILVDPGTSAVTGIIDWTDAAVVDRAYDLGLLYRDLGPAALDAALRHYDRSAVDEALVERATFYARCSVFEDIEYAAETGRTAYLTKALRSLDWLFPRD